MSTYIAVRDRLRWMGHKLSASTLFAQILPDIAKKAGAYARLIRLDRPIGIWLLLWPVLWALWLSSKGHPDPQVFVVFIVGTVLTRSAGCAINDFSDRKFDGQVARTKNRPLVTGEVDPIEAVALCIAFGFIALGLVLTLSRLTQLMALVGAVLLLTYPLMKRFFPLPQFYLGLAFTWSVPMAYAAQTGAVPRIAWLLFIAGLLWTMVYDTMYAMADREDDRKLGIRSTALLFGDADRFIIGVMQLMTLLALWFAGENLELKTWFRAGLAVAAVFALYEQVLIRHRDPVRCTRAFLNNNYFGMAIFIGIALEFVFKPS
jgi:4-hydroxybenzoate polyprenyltransferase